MDVFDYADYLVLNYPDGHALKEKMNRGSTFYKYHKAIAYSLLDVDNKLKSLITQHNYNTTSLLIDEWGETAGIPGKCFGTFQTEKDKLAAINFKIQADGLQTEQDVIDLIELMGFVVTIYQGFDVYSDPLLFPSIIWSSVKEARNTVVIHITSRGFKSTFPATFPMVFGDISEKVSCAVFPVPFPWPFFGGVINQVKCLLSHIVPATTQIIYPE